MKIILKRSGFAFFLVAIIFVCSCKKEKVAGKPEMKPQRIKLITPHLNFKSSSNTTFTYFEDGRLRYVDLNTVFLEHDRLDYTYPDGKLKIVTYQVGAEVEAWAKRADIDFIYTGDKLTKVNVAGVTHSIPNISYVFNYTGGPTPSSYTVTTWNDRLTFPEVKNYRLTLDAKGNISKSERDLYQDSFEYDDKPNPLYKLPWMDMINGTVNYDNAYGNGIIHIFDVNAFFSPNNIKKIVRNYQGNKINTEATEYTYTESGQPKKAAVVVDGEFPSSGQIEYFYESTANPE